MVELDYTTAFELMVASLLAAQNRDTNINKITPNLFRKYRGPADYVSMDQAELEQDIHKAGFFRQKSRAIKALSQKLIDDFGGDVPQTMNELLTLPGVGRKTANVILCFAVGQASGIVVDTHHIRLSERLGLSDKKGADKIEKDLMEIVPKKDWIIWSSIMTLHGRRVCEAKQPKCEICVLNEICPSSRV